MPPEPEAKIVDGVAPNSTLISVIGALFVGFLQLPGWLLLGLAALAVYGMRYYHPTSFESRFSYIKNFIFVIFFLSVIEWLARIASLFMTGHEFVGRVE
ncbi:MAG: hypothetical protein Q7J32_02775 [Sphingomonadaceae bacterium]|nr:hypothetical protein [Sphingomonadaceae bacterium]